MNATSPAIAKGNTALAPIFAPVFNTGADFEARELKASPETPSFSKTEAPPFSAKEAILCRKEGV